MKYVPWSAPAQTKDDSERFYNYNIHPKLGETRVHYGRANDDKPYLNMTHGLHSDERSYVIIIIFIYSFNCFLKNIIIIIKNIFFI